MDKLYSYRHNTLFSSEFFGFSFPFSWAILHHPLDKVVSKKNQDFSNEILHLSKELAILEGVNFKCPPPFAITKNEINEFKKDEKNKNLNNFCESLDEWGPIGVMTDGEVRVCCGGLVFGNLKENSLNDIINNEQYHHAMIIS